MASVVYIWLALTMWQGVYLKGSHQNYLMLTNVLGLNSIDIIKYSNVDLFNSL